MTATTPTTSGLILAIDLGKYKSVACAYDPATGEVRFSTFETTRSELRRVVTTVYPRGRATVPGGCP